MVKPVWVAIAFAAGIAVGVLVSHKDAPDAVRQPALEAAPAVAAIDSAQIDPTPAAPAASVALTPPVRTEPMPAASMPPRVAAIEDGAHYTGYSEPIDVGSVFQKALVDSPAPGVANQLGDAHRALERELRDDSWSYPLEAELQNSLLADASVGNFTVEHVECRATACEIRLSGKGRQFEAISHWSENPQAQPWSQRLQLSMSSTIGNGDQVDRLIILKKPPKPPKLN